MNRVRSSTLFSEAKEVIPGGVNSPVRAFKSVGGHPIFIEKAKGAYLYDADDNRYIDYISSWGPLIYGHTYPPVIAAINERVLLGTSFGTPTDIETRIARLAVKMVPHIDKIRFVNSGTEACMSAIRLARGVIGRDKVIKFEGCYHGHADSFLIQAGSGVATFGKPNSPGVTKGTAKDTLSANYNDLDSVTQLVERYTNDVAAIILEPVAGNMGCIIPKKGFLEGLRKICDQYGILLIFDEVMTGFRLAQGGAQQLFDVRADIVTFGKVIGGGMPVGAFAASTDIMAHLSPEGDIYQAGTLSGNPVAMSAGYAMLSALEEDVEVYDRLAGRTTYLHKAFEDILSRRLLPYCINSIGSMISVHFTDTPVTDFATSSLGNNKLFKQFFHGMLDEGMYLPPSSFESWFLHDALSQDDLNDTIEAFERVIKKL